jgi:hypothetical protein
MARSMAGQGYARDAHFSLPWREGMDTPFRGSPQLSNDPDEVPTPEDIARLYAAEAALEGVPPREGVRLGVGDLYRFLTEPGQRLSATWMRELMASPKLRADFDALKRDLGARPLPAVAAASVGALTTRRFNGGEVRIVPSRTQAQVYVVIRYDAPPALPRALLLENETGGLVKRVLPEASELREQLLVLDRENAEDAAFVALMSDPQTKGSFLP